MKAHPPSSPRELVRWAAVAETNDCILWPFTQVNGYGRIAVSGRNVQVTHFVLNLTERPRPDLTSEHPNGALALHSCDTPLCINPRHLRWGTHMENMREMAVRRTPSNSRRRLLTDRQVLDARARWLNGETQRSIAAEFRVRESVVSQAVKRRTYRHVQHADVHASRFPVAQRRATA